MANKKISDLPLAVAMAGAELFEIDQANVSKRISAVGLFTTVLPGLSLPPSPTGDFVIPTRQSSTGAAWGVTISSLMTALHGLPGGGTTGQLLTKLSNTDYDTAWVNAGTVFSVGLSMPGIFTVSGSPVTSSGTLTAVLNTQAANTVLAGPTSGSLAPTFRLLVGADLPNPSATTLGGVQSLAAVGSRWINTISTSGVPSSTQPAFTDISGTALVTQGGTGLTAGTSGGIPYFSGATTIASSALLTASALVLGGGAGSSPTALGSLGSATTVLHGNAAGAPTFGAVVLTTDVSGVLALSNGGTNAALTASAGGIVYSSASALAVLNGTATANQALLSGASGAPAWSTATFPITTTINQILYSSAANTIVGLATMNGGILNASATGVPVLTVTPVLGVAGASTGTIGLSGLTSGVVTIQPQAAAGTFNFNLPTSAGTGGQPLLSGGGAGAPQTYGTLGVAAGGTGLIAGTSGGVLGFTASGVLASSVLLTANALMLGGGAGATPTPMASLGTTTTVLHGNVGGAPSFGAVVLTTDVSGTLPVGNGGTGAATFTANGVLLGNGVSAFGVTAAGATGSILAGNTAAAPTFQTLSSIIDMISGAPTQGAILFRGAGGWAALSPSTSGRVLTTNGAGLDPSWSTVGGTGTVTSVTVGGTTVTTTGTLPAVAYDITQSLTLTQQNQAQKNAGLPAIMRSYLAGLTLSTAGASQVFGIAAGVAADSTNVDMISLLSAYTKTMQAWAVGTGNGAIDTGSVTATWYHVYLIKRPDTGVVDVIFSLSATAPTLPTNYTLFRRIGAMKVNGSAQWIAFVQTYDRFDWVTPITEFSTTPGVTTAQTITLAGAPTGLIAQAILAGNVFDPTSSNTILYMSALAQTDVAPVAPNAITGQSPGANQAGSWYASILTNTSAQVRRRCSSTTQLCAAASYGWIDARGKDA